MSLTEASFEGNARPSDYGGDGGAYGYISSEDDVIDREFGEDGGDLLHDEGDPVGEDSYEYGPPSPRERIEEEEEDERARSSSSRPPFPRDSNRGKGHRRRPSTATPSRGRSPVRRRHASRRPTDRKSPPPRHRVGTRGSNRRQQQKHRLDEARAPPRHEHAPAWTARAKPPASSCSKNVTYAIGLVILVGLCYAWYHGAVVQDAVLPPFRFNLVNQGASPLVPCVNLTERDIESQLLKDVPLITILTDIGIHLRGRNGQQNHTCLCMHHLTGYNNVKPRRVCGILNHHRNEVDYVANPRVIRYSKQGRRVPQMSRSCATGSPELKLRPTDIWIEWDIPRIDPSRPSGHKVMQAYGRFSEDEAAVLMLALEEFEGRQACGKRQEVVSMPDTVDFR